MPLKEQFYQSISLLVVHRLLVSSSNSYRLAASSDVKFLSFITFSLSILHWTSSRPHCPLPPADLVIIRLGHLSSSMHTTCPYHFNILLNRSCRFIFWKTKINFSTIFLVI